MVEFVLVITVVFIVFVSMVQMILLMHAYNTLADAAKEGVRYAIVHGTGFCGTAASCGCSGPGSVKGKQSRQSKASVTAGGARTLVRSNVKRDRIFLENQFFHSF